MSDTELFNAAVKLPPDRRAAYLDQACGADPALRQEVESLLRAHDEPGSFLERPAAGEPTAAYRPATEGPGACVGPYKLMEQIGEGGFGLVFVAEQQRPVRRKVALKLIKPGMDTRDVLARFEAERQALALMDHPNIAKVLDAGTTESGRPYFVMELVKGVPLVEYCDGQQLPARQRLELFVSVCQAVQHAHTKGVIHRDLKPSNILVAPHDGVPVVKVIDFGVAKALGQQLTDKTIYTRFAQMIGTPLYMSPEQASLNALDVDTRSDVYSLGVLMYELLTGTTPFDRRRFAAAAYDEVRRILKEEEPPKPSTRLSTLGEALPEVSARRRTEPAKLSALVKGDLDWIVMKALEKDRNRRYETASAFAADVRRFLAQEPVEARPPSAWYRFGKLVRRNKLALTTAGAVTGALLLGAVVATWQAVRATGAQRRAQGEAERAAANEQEALTQRDQARAARERLRHTVYAHALALAQAAWEADDLAEFDQLLARQRPEGGLPDLRGFEWHYWDRLRHAERRSVRLAGHTPVAVPLSEGGAPVRIGTDAALSPDGRRYAAVVVEGGRGALRVWDTATGRAVNTLQTGLDYKSFLTSGHTIRFSPDGRRVAMNGLAVKGLSGPDVKFGGELSEAPADARHEVWVWEVETGRELLRVSAATSPGGPGDLAYSPAGESVAFATPAGANKAQPFRVHVYDLPTRRERLTIPTDERPWCLAFSPDGRRLAGGTVPQPAAGKGSADSKVRVWDLATGKEAFAVGYPGKTVVAKADGAADARRPWYVGAVVFSPDGSRLAALGGDLAKEQTLTVYDGRTGQEVKAIHGLPTPSGAALALAFSPDGRRFARPAGHSRVHVWDLETGRVQQTVRGHAQPPAVAFTADGTRLITAGPDGLVKEWDATPPEAPTPATLRCEGRRLAYAFHPDGLRLARLVPDEGKPGSPAEIRIWSGATGRGLTVLKLPARPGGLPSLVFSPGGTRLAAVVSTPGQELGEVRTRLHVWDAGTGKQLMTQKGTVHGLLSDYAAVAFSPDGARVAWSELNERVRAWEVATAKPLLDVRERRWDSFSIDLAFSPDGSRLAWGGETGVRVWDVTGGRELLQIPTASEHGGVPGVLTFSPDGRRLAAVFGASQAPATVVVWDAAGGQQVLRLKAHQGLKHLTFSPDGRRLATLGWAGAGNGRRQEVRLWDAGNGLPLLRLDYTGDLGGGEVRFHPGGERLYLFAVWTDRVSPAGYRRVWDATPRP